MRYHTWWPSSSDPFYQANIAENTARTNYYQPGSKYVPRAFIDGIVDGGSGYSNWGNLIRSRVPIIRLVNIQTDAYFTAPRDGKVVVEVEATLPIPFTDLRLFLVITEDGIPYGGSTYNQTMRDMIPGSGGDPVVLVFPGDTLLREYDFSLNASWNIDSCNAVVFLQDYSTKEILHSTTSKIMDLIERDVLPTQLLAPGPFVACDSSYSVQARVLNAGEMVETFDVNCSIDTMGQTIYSETETVTSLAPGNTSDVTFTPEWLVPIAPDMIYDIAIVTMLAGEDSTQNDTLFYSTTGRCERDVSPTSIIWPSDTIYCASSSIPRVVVANLGQTEEDFDVVLSIDSSGTNLYSDTAAVFALAAAQTTTVDFSTWTVPASDGVTYDLTALTMLTDDSDSSNDTLQETSWGWCYNWEDVYPSLVVWPVDTVLCGSLGTFTVWVVNSGGVDEDFDVVVQVDTNGTVLHGDTASVADLTAGDSIEVQVGDWTVPDLDNATVDTRFWTLLASDSLTDNDTLPGYFYAACTYHDCGVEAILAPPDTVSIDTANTPRVSVRNWGTVTEAFDVICTIDGYADTQQVASLLPDGSTEVVFAPWNTAIPGSHLMTVITKLLNDENPQNDTASKTIWGLTGVGEGMTSVRAPLFTRILKTSPNPFSISTRISYAVAIPGRTSLGVYDVSGRLLCMLFDGYLMPGYYSALWNGEDGSGAPVPGGVYFYKLRVGKMEATRKTVLVR